MSLLAQLPLQFRKSLLVELDLCSFTMHSGYEKFSCIVTGDNKLISGYFLFPWAVDVIITVVSFIKIAQLTKKTDSPILRVFAREGVIFFAVVFFCNMANGSERADCCTLYYG